MPFDVYPSETKPSGFIAANLLLNFLSFLNLCIVSQQSPSTHHPSTDTPNVAGGSQSPKRKIAPNDIAFNVSLKEAMIRFGVMLLLPIVLLFADKHLIIYSVPIVIYLFITGITRFCVVKYTWRRIIKHEGPIASPAYGKDISYPDEGAS